jgi:hypothetical protein
VRLYLKLILVLALSVVVQREVLAQWPRIWFVVRCGLVDLTRDQQLHERLIVEGQEECRRECDAPVMIKSAAG